MSRQTVDQATVIQNQAQKEQRSIVDKPIGRLLSEMLATIKQNIDAQMFLVANHLGRFVYKLYSLF